MMWETSSRFSTSRIFFETMRVFLPPLLEGNKEKDGVEHADDVEVANLDPSMFLYSTYYSFRWDFGNYFVDWC